mgnify:FL=1
MIVVVAGLRSIRDHGSLVIRGFVVAFPSPAHHPFAHLCTWSGLE